MCVVVLCSIFFVQSCDDIDTEDLFKQTVSNRKSGLKENEFRYLNKIGEAKNGESIWEAQLNKIIEVIEDSFFYKSNGLELIKYQYVSQIRHLDDLKHVKSEILNNQSYFPAYFNNSKRFVVKEFEQSQKSVLVDILDEMIPTSQIEKDLSVVEIQWKYN